MRKNYIFLFAPVQGPHQMSGELRAENGEV